MDAIVVFGVAIVALAILCPSATAGSIFIDNPETPCVACPSVTVDGKPVSHGVIQTAGDFPMVCIESECRRVFSPKNDKFTIQVNCENHPSASAPVVQLEHNVPIVTPTPTPITTTIPTPTPIPTEVVGDQNGPLPNPTTTPAPTSEPSIQPTQEPKQTVHENNGNGQGSVGNEIASSHSGKAVKSK